jgi:DNA-binding CsgD family transcriptional regulator
MSQWPLIGRDSQLRMFEEALAVARGEGFAVVEVSGDPGVGKSRMLAELHHRATASGFMVYAGRGTQFELEVPFGTFAEALRPLGFDAVDGVSLPSDRLRVCTVVRRMIEGAMTGSVVIILDDLHWADSASLELTEYLIHRPPQVSLLMAVSYRGAQPPAGVIDAIAHAGAAAFRVALAPLTATELTRLLSGMPAQRRDLIVRASLGNPFYAQTISRLSDDALARLVDDHPPVHGWADGSTRPILAGIAAELLVLDQPVRRVAHAAAVIGEDVAIDMVAHTAQLPAPVVAEAVDTLHLAGLVDVDGMRFRFRHPLVRASAHEQAGHAWRVSAHARAAAFLRANGGPLRLIAHHTERSASHGDEIAATTLIEAGRAFAYSAPAAAARWLGTALRMLPATGSLAEGRDSIMLQYARALGLSGALELSRQVLQELIDADGATRAEALAFSVVIARLRGDIDEAKALVRAQLTDRSPRPGTEGKLHLEMAAIAALQTDATGALSHARQALTMLDGRAELTAAAQTLRAFGAIYGGDVKAAQRYVAEATRLTDTTNDRALVPHLELFGPLAWIEMELGLLVDAGRHLHRARAVAETVGRSSALPYLLVVASALETRRGQLSRAIQLAEDAAAAARLVGSDEMRGMAEAVRLRPLLWTSGPLPAIQAAERLAQTDRPRAVMWRRLAQVNLACAYAFAGDVGLCLRATTMPWPGDAPTAVVLGTARAVALARGGDLARAHDEAERVRTTADKAGLDYECGLSSYAAAYVEARSGRLGEAAFLADTAAMVFAAADAPVQDSIARHLAAVVHTRAGRSARGRAELDRAKAGYRDCGADWLLDVITRDEARLFASTPASDVATLTTRELEIARLAAEGLSNQEIASRLYLSRRTVESHLSRIFAKLDVHTRTAMVNRLGIRQ